MQRLELKPTHKPVQNYYAALRQFDDLGVMNPRRLHNVMRSKQPSQPINLNWNSLHVQARKEICYGACISEELAGKSWEKLEEWV